MIVNQILIWDKTLPPVHRQSVGGLWVLCVGIVRLSNDDSENGTSPARRIRSDSLISISPIEPDKVRRHLSGSTDSTPVGTMTFIAQRFSFGSAGPRRTLCPAGTAQGALDWCRAYGTHFVSPLPETQRESVGLPRLGSFRDCHRYVSGVSYSNITTQSALQFSFPKCCFSRLPEYSAHCIRADITVTNPRSKP